MVETLDAGLCDRCVYSKRIESGRGSVFRLCLMHERDAQFAKYPRLPVVRCPGYAERPAPPG